MDELLSALIEVRQYYVQYAKCLENDGNELLRLVNETEANLGNDTLTKKTTATLITILKNFRTVAVEVSEEVKRLDMKINELIILRDIMGSDDGAPKAFGQKNLHSEILSNGSGRRI